MYKILAKSVEVAAKIQLIRISRRQAIMCDVKIIYKLDVYKNGL
jgi:hypothetical protein